MVFANYSDNYHAISQNTKCLPQKIKVIVPDCPRRHGEGVLWDLQDPGHHGEVPGRTQVRKVQLAGQ